MLTSRDLNDLNQATKKLAVAFLDECKKNGLDILITCTRRDADAQNALYASGRTVKGRILTNLKGGQSKHEFGDAFDFCVMKHGKCDWNNLDAFKRAGEVGERVGLIWAGRWTGKFKESCHLERKA